jgi:polar amino acid transport system permease protein
LSLVVGHFSPAPAGPTSFVFQFDLQFFLSFVFQPTGALLSGLALTVYVSVLAQAIGTGIGVLSALAGMSRRASFRAVNGVYIWFFRGTPLLVQIFVLYYGTPYLLGVDLFPTDIHFFAISVHGNVIAGLAALAVNEGAYMSEIIRAGIMSVDTGQTEAAKSVGMTNSLTMRRIVLPQAARLIIPPLGNEFNSMIKATALLSTIAVTDLFRVAQGVNSSTFKSFEAYFGVAIYYLVITTVWGQVQKRIERRFSAGVRRHGGLQANSSSAPPGAAAPDRPVIHDQR